jgi:hypothetical protein
MQDTSVAQSAPLIAPLPDRQQPKPKPKETKQQRAKRLRAARAKRKQGRQKLRQRLAEDDDAVLTFREWCAVNSVGERTGRRILASGNGPTITKLSDKRIGISRRHNRAWQETRAKASA